LLGLRCWFAGLPIRYAAVEVGQLLRCRLVPAAVRQVPRASAGCSPYHGRNTYGLSRYLWPSFDGRTYLLRLFKAVTGQLSGPQTAEYWTGHDRSSIRPSQGRIFDRSWLAAFDRWRNMTVHIAYSIFDRPPVKCTVPFFYLDNLTQDT